MRLLIKSCGGRFSNFAGVDSLCGSCSIQWHNFLAGLLSEPNPDLDALSIQAKMLDRIIEEVLKEDGKIEDITHEELNALYHLRDTLQTNR